MLKNKILLVLITLIVPCLLKAIESEKTNHFFYGKVGASYNPAVLGSPLPMAGVGARVRKNNFGADFSANAASLYVVNAFSAKAHALAYPGPKKQFYAGLGGGINHYRYLGSGSTELSAEGVIGYEFENRSYGRKFVQLEISNPARAKFQPAISISFGIGF